MAEPIRWDGRPETVERLREVMPECVVSFFSNQLTVKTFRYTSEKRGVLDTRMVPLGSAMARKKCRLGAYIALTPPTEEWSWEAPEDSLLAARTAQARFHEPADVRELQREQVGLGEIAATWGAGLTSPRCKQI